MIDRYLPDTHSIYWYEIRSPKLSPRGKEIFDGAKQRRHALLLHPIVVAELAWLLRKAGRSDQFGRFMDYSRTEGGYETIELTVRDAAIAATLEEVSELHDRLIAATAIRLEVPVLTADAVLRESREIKTIW